MHVKENDSTPGDRKTGKYEANVGRKTGIFKGVISWSNKLEWSFIYSLFVLSYELYINQVLYH